MKTLCIVLLLLLAPTVQGQETFHKHIGINFLGQRPIPQIISLRRSEKYLFAPLGISYMQSFRYFNIRVGLNYYKLTEEAKTQTKTQRCYDCLHGTGKVEGIEVKAGVQKIITHSNCFAFLGGIDFGYSSSTYKGHYQGGVLGGGYKANEINNTYILNPYIGLSITPFKRMLIMLETGIFISSRRTHRIITDATQKRSEQYLLPLQVLTVYWNFR